MVKDLVIVIEKGAKRKNLVTSSPPPYSTLKIYFWNGKEETEASRFRAGMGWSQVRPEM